jgi:hypothetical protein
MAISNSKRLNAFDTVVITVPNTVNLKFPLNFFKIIRFSHFKMEMSGKVRQQKQVTSEMIL